MRLLWSLPKAAPALLRHMAGYAELAGQDLDQWQRHIGARVLAVAVLGVSIAFVLFFCCLMVIALTWDTPYRVAAIAWMGGFFLLSAIVAGVYQAKVAAKQPAFLATVKHEWHEDRVILEHILSSDEE